jgi:multiple sugar transport system permease protein
MASEQTIGGALQRPDLATARFGRRSGSHDGAFRYGMTLPTVLALLLVVAFPLAFALYVSTHDYDLTKGGIGAFTGIANYVRTISDDEIGHAARNTVILSVSVVAIGLAVALGLSVLLN